MTDSLTAEITKWLGPQVVIKWSQSHSVLLALKKKNNAWVVQIHEHFRHAPQEIHTAVGKYLTSRHKDSSKLIDLYIDENPIAFRKSPTKSQSKMRTRGLHYDLKEIYHCLNDAYFGNHICAHITWGKRSNTAANRKKSIRFGCYDGEHKLITIHPVLDQAIVPRFFVDYVVFHEMLHQKHPAERGSTGDRIVHTKAFREEEKQFKQKKDADTWIKQHLNRMLSFRAIQVI